MTEKLINRKSKKLYVKWKGYNNSLIVGLMKKLWLYKMSCFPESHTHSKNQIKVELDLSNYAIKFDLRNETVVYTSYFVEKADLLTMTNKIFETKSGFHVK